MDVTKEQKIEIFEDQVMTALLAGDDPILAVFRKQYNNAKKNQKKSSYTENGFLISYDVPNNDIQRVSLRQYRKSKSRKRPFHYHFYITDVMVSFPATNTMFRVSLFLDPKKERLSFVESNMLKTGENLPEIPINYKIFYVLPYIENDKMKWKETPDRNMQYVRGVWWNIWRQRKPRVSISRIKKWLQGYPGNPLIPD